MPIYAVVEGGSFTIEDAQRPIITYPIETVHCDDMLLSYMPTAQIVFNSDLLTTSSPLTIQPSAIPAAEELYQAITSLGIASPDLTIVGGHGSAPTTYAALETALGH